MNAKQELNRSIEVEICPCCSVSWKYS